MKAPGSADYAVSTDSCWVRSSRNPQTPLGRVQTESDARFQLGWSLLNGEKFASMHCSSLWKGSLSLLARVLRFGQENESLSMNTISESSFSNALEQIESQPGPIIVILWREDLSALLSLHHSPIKLNQRLAPSSVEQQNDGFTAKTVNGMNIVA